MGLFAPSPEEPTEWAGLPSEPLEPKSAAERLDDDAPDAIGLVTGVGVASISIPLGAVEPLAPGEPSEGAGDAADA